MERRRRFTCKYHSSLLRERGNSRRASLFHVDKREKEKGQTQKETKEGPSEEISLSREKARQIIEKKKEKGRTADRREGEKRAMERITTLA